jgi:hypothetical protein
MDPTAFFTWLQQTAWATTIRQDETLFPLIESLHVLAITAVLGTISIVDLRLIGLTSREQPISKTMAEVLPLTRIAFFFAALTGVLLFASHAVDYSHKAPFIAKMVLLSVALVNIAIFHLLTARGIDAWDTEPKVPLAVKSAGAVSLGLWVAIVACGRWIGFV